MGIFERLFKTRSIKSADPLPSYPIPKSAWGLTKIAGTTTFQKEQANRVGLLIAGPAPGYAVTHGVLRNGTYGESQDHTVYVVVQGEPIGALYSYLLKNIHLDNDEDIPVSVQIFTSETPKGLRVDAWVWIGKNRPNWQYSKIQRPPTTTRERAVERHAKITDIVSTMSAPGSRRWRYYGVHYLETIEPIKQLKREGRLEEALSLAYLAIKGAELDKGLRSPAPGYTIQAAIILRKLKRYDEEVAVLQRWMSQAIDGEREQSKVAERLEAINKRDYRNKGK